MIKNYQDFINESIDLILESDVVYSDNFRKIVSKITSPVAKKLLDIENKDLPVRSNFFDIVPAKNDTISFMADRRAQDILGSESLKVRYSGSGGWLKHKDSNSEIFNKLGYTPVGEPYEPNSQAIGEIIAQTVSETSGNTYCWVKFKNRNDEDLGQGVYNKQKLVNYDDRKEKVWGKGRQEIGVGRGIRALLLTTGEKFLDKDIEEFVNLYKAAIDKFNDKFSFFEVVTGSDIAHWYHNRNYFIRSGTLGSSCMAGVPASWLEIYTENPEQVALIIYKSQEDTDKIIGRALLWTLNDGKKFVDRIYTVNDSDVQLFRDYAKENGWYTKYHNSSTTNSQAIAPDGSNVSLRLVVTLNKKYYDHFPYLDTLKYFTPGSGVLNNSDGEYTLEDTGGDYVRCECCGGSGRVECGDCYGNGQEECRYCDGSGREDCDECDGNGNRQCSNCDGSGQVEGEDDETEDCPECNGDGHLECDDCNGGGRVDCHHCDGDGEFECSNCDGRGEVDCYECN